MPAGVQGTGPGDRHTSLGFAGGLLGSELLIRIDYSNLALSRRGNIGLDNLRFGQPAVCRHRRVQPACRRALRCR